MVGRFGDKSRETWTEFKAGVHAYKPKRRPSGVRAPIVAEKPGNSGGAKGCREVET